MATTEYYLGGIRQVVDDAERAWRLLAGVLAKQYEAAYNAHQAVLTRAKVNVENRKKQEEAAQALAFGIVTAGLLGPFSKVLSSPIDAVIKQVPEGTSTYLLQVASNTAAKITSKTIDKIASLGASLGDSPQETADGFSPVGMTPMTYWISLNDNVGRVFTRLQKTSEIIWETCTAFPPDKAEIMYQSFKSQCWGNIGELGDLENSGFQNAIKNQAEAALWITWLRVRDYNWWADVDDHLYDFGGNGKAADWAELATVFRRLLLPISIKYTMVRWDRVDVVDMPQAITFARTPGAFQVVTAPLRKLTKVNNPDLVDLLSSKSTL